MDQHAISHSIKPDPTLKENTKGGEKRDSWWRRHDADSAAGAQSVKEFPQCLRALTVNHSSHIAVLPACKAQL